MQSFAAIESCADDPARMKTQVSPSSWEELISEFTQITTKPDLTKTAK